MSNQSSERVNERGDEADWTTWSDGELMARLLRRGIEAVTAKGWVRDRQTEYAVDEIEAVLNIEQVNDEGRKVLLETPLDRRPPR